MDEVRIPTWEEDIWGNRMLAVPRTLWTEAASHGTCDTLVDMHGMRGRPFATMYPPNRDVVLLIPQIYYTYCCEHRGEPKKPECPQCGAMVIAWQ